MRIIRWNDSSSNYTNNMKTRWLIKRHIITFPLNYRCYISQRFFLPMRACCFHNNIDSHLNIRVLLFARDIVITQSRVKRWCNYPNLISYQKFYIIKYMLNNFWLLCRNNLNILRVHLSSILGRFLQVRFYKNIENTCINLCITEKSKHQVRKMPQFCDL